MLFRSLGLRAGGRRRIAAGFGLYAFVACLLANAAFVFWSGGAAMGPRYMLPLFVGLPLGLAEVTRADRGSGGGPVTVALGALSVLPSFPEPERLARGKR